MFIKSTSRHITKAAKKVRKIIHQHKKALQETAVILLALGVFCAGGLVIWISTFQLPDLNAFEQRKVSESTKIYDRTGKILLHDVHENIKRTLVPYDEISRNVKNATVAIEDAEFYQHSGIKPTAILRSVWVNLTAGSYSQGGSTITQQVIKNALLTQEKLLSRKIKEWVLALKLEQILDKDTILGIYLNENPYGGTIYGIEQASEEYFGKNASDLTIAESAYLAALPQAPSFYLRNRDRLEARKNLVLQKMLENGFITQTEYDTARKEKVAFNPAEDKGIKAPHFVFYVKDYLVEKYGTNAVQEGGLKVITTLDYELQQKAEEIVKKYAIDNMAQLDAENAALVAIDPKTGQILTMVGSRDYFDKEIGGNFNVITQGRRQPGSSFKPFIYAEAFRKGYTPDTVLFDLKTEFSSNCTASSTPKFEGAVCYSPNNYDGTFRGPINLRNALAQSINVPAVKLLYLVGIDDALNLAKDMGIKSIVDGNDPGLTLVLGGAPVSPLEMTSAYGVFANNGARNPETGILRVEDKSGRVLEEYQKKETQVLDKNIALTVSDVLSDNKARAPIFGSNSALYFPGRDVAAKTGTTNDFKDAWIIGYTPSIVVGAWAGNNDGRPVKKEGSARQVVAPMWNAFMYETFKHYAVEDFEQPAPLENPSEKPAINGLWQGGKSYFIDKISGKLATEFTPAEYREQKVIREVHSILHWVDKSDPLGPVPADPTQDSQYLAWEGPVREWALRNGYADQTDSVIPTLKDDVHLPQYAPIINYLSPIANASYSRENALVISLSLSSRFPIQKVEYYLNNNYLGSTDRAPFTYTIFPRDNDIVETENTLRAVVTDNVGNKSEKTVNFKLLLSGN